MDLHDPASTSLTSTISRSRHAAVRSVLIDAVRSDVPIAAPRRRPRARWVALAAAPALAAAAVGAVVTDSTSSRPAHTPTHAVHWTPVAQVLPPPPPVYGKADHWTNACDGVKVEGAGRGGGGAAADGPGYAAVSARDTHHVLIERRADSVLCVDVAIGNGTPAQPTVALGELTYPIPVGDSRWSDWKRPVAPPTSGSVTILGGDRTDVSYSDDSPAHLVYGMVSPEVTGVDVVLTNGLHITASVSDGLWAAWWPTDRGDALGAQLVVHTAESQRSVDPVTVRVPADDGVVY